MGEKINAVRARKKQRLPVVLSKEEVSRLLKAMSGVHELMAQLMYGCGLRVMEVLRLRVQELDFDQGLLLVRRGKGDKDRSTILLPELHVPLKDHVIFVRKLYEQDVENGTCNVYLPHALAQKYRGGPRAWNWQYVFASKSLSVDPRAGVRRRHHMDESSIQKSVVHAACLV